MRRGPCTGSRSSGRRAGVALVAVAMLAIGAVPVVASTTSAGAATGAGRSIGDAQTLTGSATGSLATQLADDWYVVYPDTLGGTVTINIEDTTATASNCDSLDVTIRDTNGAARANAGLVPHSSYDTPFSAPNSDRYFVELTTNNCNPSSAPVAYSLALESGGGGTAPSPAKQSGDPGATIGDVRAPLQGATSYTGTIDSGVSDDWFVLSKHAGTAPATVRVENTTVKGSTDCTGLAATFRNTDGHTLQNAGLGDNTAFTFSTATAGRYYLELTDNNCTDGGTTYRIEPEQSGSWDQPAELPMQKLPTGPTRANAGGPIMGGIDYSAKIPNSQTQLWAKVDTNGKAPVVTISTQNATNHQANCTGVAVTLSDAAGHTLQNAGLGDNTGAEFAIDTTSEFFLEITDDNCVPTTPQKPTVNVTVTPAKGVSGGDGRVPAKQLSTSAAGQAFIKSYEQPKKSLFVPYNDNLGHCTVGWGHLVHKGGGKCTAQDLATTYTQAQIDGFWSTDLANHEQRLKKSIGNVPLKQQEFDALSSFVFNLGAICGEGFETICADLKAQPPNYAKAAKDLKLYDTDGHGHVICGLYRRRLDEGQMFTMGDYARNAPKCP